MQYLLVRQDDAAAEPVTLGDFTSDYAAAEAARSWLEDNAENDRYLLTPVDRAHSWLMIRTVAGQWYAMPLAPADT